MPWERASDVMLDTVLKVRPGEKLVIVTDDDALEVARALHQRAHEKGLDPTLCLMPVRSKPHEDPPDPIAVALRSADCGIIAVTKSITHSRARNDATRAGVRIASMPGACPRMFEDGSLEADASVIKPLCEWIDDQITAGDEVRITSDRGTDLTLSVAGRTAGGSFGLADVKGGFTVIPCLEATVGPVEWSANGRLVVDGCVVPGGLVEDPIEIVVEKGTIMSMTGGVDAEKLKTLLAGYNDPNVYHLAELGIGLNPKAVMGFDIAAEDEGVYGTIHFGFGEGRSFGTAITASTHTDVVLTDGRVQVDGRTILDHREFTFPQPTARA
jgi:leucyl aminopeptidase (aminopeptidase T)